MRVPSDPGLGCPSHLELNTVAQAEAIAVAILRENALVLYQSASSISKS